MFHFGHVGGYVNVFEELFWKVAAGQAEAGAFVPLFK